MADPMAARFPTWKVPKNLKSILEEEEVWEDSRWQPLLLSVLGGTTYDGRDIPMCWQVEFEAGDDFFAPLLDRLAEAGMVPDGYAWLEVVRRHLGKTNSEILEKLHDDDTENAACVVWVETERDARALVESVWTMLHDPKGPRSWSVDEWVKASAEADA